MGIFLKGTKRLAALSMIASCICMADAARTLSTDNGPHHMYFGPEFLCYQLNKHVGSIHVHGARFFWGFKYGYEYWKSNMVYAGIDLVATRNNVDFQASRNKPMSWHRADRGFGNIEVRLGYAAVLDEWRLTPFFAAGYFGVYELDHHNSQGFRESLPYGAAGLRSQYVTDGYWNLGLYWKILRTYASEQRFKYQKGMAVDHENFWGAEVGVPFTWYIGHKKRWNMELEPYFLTFGFPGTQNIYGLHWTFAYNF